MSAKIFKTVLTAAILFLIIMITGCSGPVAESVSSPPAVKDGNVIIEVAAAQGDYPYNSGVTPYQAGRQAAEQLKEKLNGVVPHAVILAEFFEGKSAKQQALKGVSSVFDSKTVYGFTTYGSFGQDGCSDSDTIRLIGIAGEGISVAAALQQDLGVSKLTVENDEPLLKERLQTAGQSIAAKLPKTDNSKLMILIPDAHSPKNACIVQGVHKELGEDFPITGGSPNKNPGQTYVYYQGQMFTESAIAFMLSGDFNVSMTGRKAMDNSKVISTAGRAFGQAKEKLDAKPFAAIAFNCAGRKGKLDNLEDELAAIQDQVGTEMPIFGTYCAGEIGPADISESSESPLSTGVGWHLMVNLFGK